MSLRNNELNRMQPEQKSIFNCIFLNEYPVTIKIWLKLILKGPNDNKLALVKIMAWCPTGDKPLPEKFWLSSSHHMVS